MLSATVYTDWITNNMRSVDYSTTGTESVVIRFNDQFDNRLRVTEMSQRLASCAAQYSIQTSYILVKPIHCLTRTLFWIFFFWQSQHARSHFDVNCWEFYVVLHRKCFHSSKRGIGYNLSSWTLLSFLSSTQKSIISPHRIPSQFRDTHPVWAGSVSSISGILATLFYKFSMALD